MRQTELIWLQTTINTKQRCPREHGDREVSIGAARGAPAACAVSSSRPRTPAPTAPPHRRPPWEGHFRTDPLPVGRRPVARHPGRLILLWWSGIVFLSISLSSNVLIYPCLALFLPLFYPYNLPTLLHHYRFRVNLKVPWLLILNTIYASNH